MNEIKDAPWIGNPDYGKNYKIITVRRIVEQEIEIEMEEDCDPIEVAKHCGDREWDTISVIEYSEV